MRVVMILFMAVVLSSCAANNNVTDSPGVTSSTYQPLAPTESEQQQEQMQRSVYQ